MNRIWIFSLRYSLLAFLIAGIFHISSGCSVFAPARSEVASPTSIETQPVSVDRDLESTPTAVLPVTGSGKSENTGLPDVVPEPLPQTVISSCPVSLPNLTESPNEYYISAESGFGNPEGTMFIGLWPGGVVYFCPGCAGQVEPDGSMSMKFWFYRTVQGVVTIEGQRLDEPGQVVHLATLRGPDDGYSKTGFHPAGLVFPSQGCWEVTARAGASEMTFTTLVLWVSYKPAWLYWLPEGFLPAGPVLAGYPETFEDRFRSAEGGEISVETSQAPLAGLDNPTHEESVTVNGKAGTCTLQEAADTPAGALVWSDGSLYYRVRFSGVNLTCEDLLKAATQPPG